MVQKFVEYGFLAPINEPSDIHVEKKENSFASAIYNGKTYTNN